MKRLFTLILILFCFADVKGQILWEESVPTTNLAGGFGEFVLRDSLIFLRASGGVGVTDPHAVHYRCYSLTGRQKWSTQVFTKPYVYPNRHILTQNDYVIQVGSIPRGYPTYTDKIYTQKISIITGDTLTRKYINTTAFLDFGQTGILNDADGGFTIAAASLIRTSPQGLSGKRKSSILKLDSAQNLVWQKHYGPGRSLNTHGLMRNASGNYILGGDIMHLLPAFGVWHPFVFEVKPNGDSLRRKTVFLTDTTNLVHTEYTQDFLQTNDGGYVFYGSIDTTVQTVAADYLYFVAKVDSLFNPVWIYKNIGRFEDYPIRKIQLLPDGGFALLSTYEDGPSSSYFIIRLNQNGLYVSHQELSSNICNLVYLIDFKLLSDSSAIVSGAICGGNNAYLARINNVLSPGVVNNAPENIGGYSNLLTEAYPNPANETVKFNYNLPPKVKQAEIQIHEIATGKLVQKVILNPTRKQQQTSLTMLYSGMYSYTLLVDGIPVSTKKLVVVK